MAEYHVGSSPITGEIYAGTSKQIKTGSVWINKSHVTDEAIAAVREHMLSKMKADDSGFQYEWRRKADGKIVRLTLTVEDADKSEET